MDPSHRLATLLVALAACAASDASKPAERGAGVVPASAAALTECLTPDTPDAAGATGCLGSAGQADGAGGRNVLGGPLQACPSRHRTGFYRDGFCNTGADDHGVHVVCARVTDPFLAFSRSQGNDLVTPRGSFAGLQDGDGWCLCASRWQQAHEAGVAPPVVLEATHEAALRVSRLDDLTGAKAP
jgi:hypothetical protein